MPDDNGNETEEERIDRLVNARLDARTKETERADLLKSLGLKPEALNVIADAVYERFVKAAADATAAEEKKDQPPKPGDKPKRGLFGSILDS